MLDLHFLDFQGFKSFLKKILSNSSEYQDFFFPFWKAYLFLWHSYFKVLYKNIKSFFF